MDFDEWWESAASLQYDKEDFRVAYEAGQRDVNDELLEVLIEIRGHLLAGNWPSGTTDKHKLFQMANEAIAKADKLK